MKECWFCGEDVTGRKCSVCGYPTDALYSSPQGYRKAMIMAFLGTGVMNKGLGRLVRRFMTADGYNSMGLQVGPFRLENNWGECRPDGSEGWEAWSLLGDFGRVQVQFLGKPFPRPR